MKNKHELLIYTHHNVGTRYSCNHVSLKLTNEKFDIKLLKIISVYDHVLRLTQAHIMAELLTNATMV